MSLLLLVLIAPILLAVLFLSLVGLVAIRLLIDAMTHLSDADWDELNALLKKKDRTPDERYRVFMLLGHGFNVVLKKVRRLSKIKAKKECNDNQMT